MRKILGMVFGLLMASLIVIGSSGTFVSFNAAREVRVSVVPHGEEYLGFMCEDGYSAVVTVGANEEADFVALTVRNHLNEMKDVTIRLHPDYSGLPENVTMFVETEDGALRVIPSGGEYAFSGNVTVRNAEPGEYVVPVQMIATWSGGDASISTCPIKLVIIGSPTIEKELLSGPLELPTHTYAQWTFRITITNPGMERDLTIRDVVPGEFEIDSITPSAGTYSVTQTGAAHHITWEVHLEAGESAHLDVTVHTKLNPGGQQEFTSCGDYVLNEGAELLDYGVRSDNITVKATCGGSGNDCRLCVSSRVVSGPRFLSPGQSADYHTRIFVRNGGSAKDVTIEQIVGPDFSVTGHSESTGSLSVSPDPRGSLVTWSFHLNEGETATLDLYEHTDGIYARRALLTGRVHVVGCGCHGCPHYVYIRSCHGCRGSAPETESQDAGIESESCEGECE